MTDAQLLRLNRLEKDFESYRIGSIEIPGTTGTSLDLGTHKKARVWNEYIQGHVTFIRGPGSWRVSHTDHDLSFLSGMNAKEAKLDLLKRGFDWEWVD